MYRVIYFKAFNNVINDIKECFHQPDFEIYKRKKNFIINAVNQNCYGDSLSLLKKIHERDFHWENLTI